MAVGKYFETSEFVMLTFAHAQPMFDRGILVLTSSVLNVTL